MKKTLLSILMTGAIVTTGYAQNYMSKTIQHASLTREYSIYIPVSYDGTTSFPLLFNFHGGNDVIANWQTSADMRPIADTADFILVYPQARPDPSDGNSLNWLPKIQGTFDDVPFINALIDTVAIDYQIDQNKIYACGYSLGGEFSYELACKLNNRIAAIGAVARTMQENPSSYCSPVHPTGVLTILGTNDFISPYGGFPGYYLSAAATHSYWASHNNCNPTATMSTVSPSVERYTWSTGSGCVYVEELKVIGGGHDWPGSFGNTTIDASTEIWQFVSRYDINGLIGCTTTSINENNSTANNFSVYPNPFNSQITIEKELPDNTEFSVYSVLGKLLLTGSLEYGFNKIDFSSLPQNVYILQVENQLIKLIKEK